MDFTGIGFKTGKKSKASKNLYQEVMNKEMETQSKAVDIPTILSSQDLSQHTHSFKLPSKGIFYKNKIDSVLLMPLTIGQLCDIDVAMQIPTEGDKLRQLFTILSNSIYGISIFDMTMPDFYATAVELRTISYRDEPISLITPVENENGEIREELCYLYEPIKVIMIDSSLVNTKDWGFATVADKLYELEHCDKLNSLEKSLFGLVRGNNSEDKLNIFRSYSIDKIDFMCKHLVDSIHGLDHTAKLVLESTKTIIEKEFRFSFNLIFPRIAQELLSRI